LVRVRVRPAFLVIQRLWGPAGRVLRQTPAGRQISDGRRGTAWRHRLCRRWAGLDGRAAPLAGDADVTPVVEVGGSVGTAWHQGSHICWQGSRSACCAAVYQYLCIPSPGQVPGINTNEKPCKNARPHENCYGCHGVVAVDMMVAGLETY
jgi:hypothetical protein